MKLRVYSDIHLDHYVNGAPHQWVPPVLPDDHEATLILAGDLWIGTNFIESTGDYTPTSWISSVACRFKMVLIVLGNHDYWPCSKDITIKTGAAKCNSMMYDRGIMNVKVLDCDTYEDEGVLFVGATLWTDMDKEDPLTMHNMPNYMMYDGKIAYETFPGGGWDRFTSDKWVTTHYKHRAYLKLVVEQNRDKKVVVITHHLPLLTVSDPVYAGDSGNGYYSSDLSEFILDNEHIAYWFYGHTHYQKETLLGKTNVINNCVGYKSEQLERRGLVSHNYLEV